MDYLQDQMDNICERVAILEKQSLMIARMDENIGFIRQRLETGLLDMEKVNGRLFMLEKLVPTYDQTVTNFHITKQEVDTLKAELNVYKAINSGKFTGLSFATIVAVGILNIIFLVLEVFVF